MSQIKSKSKWQRPALAFAPLRWLGSLLSWNTVKRIWKYGRSFFLFGGVGLITAVFLTIVFCVAVLPAYKNPKARMFTTGLGYGSVLRRQGKPFPVRVATPERIKFSEPILGEGILASQPVLVPIVPIDFVTHVYVARGDRVKKGQLLMELDKTRAQIRVESGRTGSFDNRVRSESRSHWFGVCAGPRAT